MRHVAVIVETSTQYGRNLIRGIARYGRLHDWQIHFEYRGKSTAEPDWLADFKGDGVITTSPDQCHSRALKEQGVAVFDLQSTMLDPAGEHLIVDSDHRAVGRMAADHFIEKGHRHFAFLGYSDHNVSREREIGFTEALAARGHKPHCHHTPERKARSFESLQKGDLSFIESLPKPCALFCCWDEVAFRAVQSAIELQIAVPEDLAVLGVDNDPVFSSTSRIPLSSIDPDIIRMGFLAASWLAELMSGKELQQIKLERLVPPKGLVIRQSTALDAIEDPVVRRFLELLRQQRPGLLSIEELSRDCHVSRRLLEQRVKAATGKTPRQLLSQTLVEGIQRFLSQTDYTLAHIADLLGFEHAERLSHLFRRQTGKTPGEYRKSTGA
ncbi:XylR family transcriptional regulator [Luteolibacter flavescens]|uniref:XylR family transcriptional regulator n=1 Tax=Luteolibacter flavescens TaxID=1859460 RepID=A0ABT3FQA3_9BACT|nr:XylR family transcriptional regulator [Luteolibacter flavescens]MCW1885758.1 XylR family transcriptional regulator [Luteolibacter flavescens]